MESEKAEEPTTAWTWPETSPGDTIDSVRCCVSGAQLTVQTFDALVKEKLAKAATTERSVLGAILARHVTMIEVGRPAGWQDKKGVDRRQALVLKRNKKGVRREKKSGTTGISQECG